MFPELTSSQDAYHQPDWEYIHQELLKKNVTLKLLHKEYEVEARLLKKIPYAYRTFCEKYGSFGRKYKLAMPIHHKPGETLETDWAGSTLEVIDSETGEKIKAFIFVASLTYSQLSYVEAFFNMKSVSWINGHINAFETFDGVPENVVPDNLKTGVIKPDYSEPILNESYRQLADYYGFTILPARVSKPRDKASVEGNVGFISRQVIAALRNHTFFSLDELNQALTEKTTEINKEPFQKKPGSRLDVFEAEEKAFLQKLRYPRFKQSEWRFCTVSLDYHIQVYTMYYSVPYEFVKSEVEVKITDDLIEVYMNQSRVASHKRLYGDIGQFSTNIDHMPDHHRSYLEHTPSENLEWARAYGYSTAQYVQSILNNNSERKALRILLTLRNMVRKFPDKDLELACEMLLSVTKHPNNKLLQSILLRQPTKNSTQRQDISNPNGFVRGKNYFGGKNNEK